MSENAHGYQTEVPVEQVTTNDASNALDEKLFSQQEAQHQNANDIEKEQSSEPETEEKDEFSSKFAALSRKEKDLRSREQEIERKIQEFEARMESFNQPEPEVAESKEPELPLEYRLKRNPLQVLEEVTGFTYEDLTKQMLNDGEMSTDARMRLMREELEQDYKSKFEQLENKLIEKEKAEEEASYQEAVESFKNDIQDYIANNEAYDLIQANDAYDLVFDVIESHHQETGRVLETQEAADQVEQYLEEEMEALRKKSRKIGSWKSEASQRVAESSRQSPTLSNSLSATGEPKADRKLSREESILNAASQIRWDD